MNVCILFSRRVMAGVVILTEVYNCLNDTTCLILSFVSICLYVFVSIFAHANFLSNVLSVDLVRKQRIKLI
jgi:hypothetical protein